MRKGRVGVILVSAFAVACGGGDANDPTDPGPTPDFTMSVSPTSLQLVLGSGVPAQAAAAQSDVSFTVTINRSGGFSESVTVTVEGLPSGVTASALVIGSGQTSGSVTLTASASANAGTSSPTVRGSATGITAKTQSLSLTLVLPPASGETFDIDFASGSASLVQGNSTSLTLDIDRSGGFMGTVTLSAASNPSGPGLSFDPANTSGTTSTLTVSATAGLTPGDYSVTATGTGGDLEVTATIILTVTASGGGGSVSIRFCPENGLPVWLAIQDGTTPWERVEEGDPGEYSFDFDTGKGGIAFVALDQDDHATIVVYYGSRDEITTFYNFPCSTDPGKDLMSSFAGVAAGEVASVSLGGASASVVGGGPLNFMLQNVSTGPIDLIASLTASLSDGMGGFELAPKRLIFRRSTNYAANSTFPTIDFTTEGIDPIRRNATVTNGLGHSLVLSSTYTTASNSAALLYADQTGATHYFGVDPSDQADGDLHIVAVSANENVMTPPIRTRNVGIYQKVAEDLTIDLGPLISNVTVTFETTGPYVRPRMQFATQDEYDRFWSASFGGFVSGNSVQIAMFEGYEPGATFDRTLPDFSPLDGFDSSWGPQMEQMFYNAIATGWESEGGIAQPQITDGGISRSAAENGIITP